MTTAPTNSPPAKTRAERIPPQDLDAERALLGSMMMSRDAVAEVRFEPVTTHALRLDVSLQADWSAGLLEWRFGSQDA